MPRFFVNKEAIVDGQVTITDSDAHHIARSLRMAVGDSVTVSDGEGAEYVCTLTKIRDEEVIASITESLEAANESPLYITLFMAYPKGDKLETVIQKAVELGASRIVPFESSRCIKRPKAEKAEKQTARLQRIAEEAAKQCGRSVIAEVTTPLGFDEMLKLASHSDLSLFCYENEDETRLKELLEKSDEIKTVSVVVGSEGGFSPEEAREAKAAGLKSISLGKRILRCETAPLYVLAAISYQFEL